MRVMLALVLTASLAWASSPDAFPFPDNPDASACGIPTAWGKSDPVRLDGHYQGKLVEPVVRLWDSHYRKQVVGRVASGTKVRIKLLQTNPVLNYYLVETVAGKHQEGWVPAPFVRLK